MQKLFIIIVAALFFMFFILCFHMEATYTVDAEVYSVNGNEVMFEDIKTHDVFSCYTKEEHPHLHKGEEFVIKLDHKGTESDRNDDGLIAFGKNCFLCFVW